MEPQKKFFFFLYGITILLFLVYIAFISDNNFSKHRELSQKIKNLEAMIFKTKNQIKNTYSFDELKRNPVLLEQYAREQMNMMKSDEDVFLLVYE
jgi:cell division protein FtsB